MGIGIIVFIVFVFSVIIVALWVTKSQSKYVETLKVGDIVDYRGRPAKILEIYDGKARIETTVSMMHIGSKVDIDEYKFGKDI